ncbi:hypothetical protein MCAL160_0957 [Mycoplasmopsis californica HAZ160_1]|uniref:Uncharacterized protein n=2 Tax=Mycoplasmopsis californica TaxID=2113 RepID=A0A059XL87_9BACT|nr:hypothetical protein [Mycoplasmopsis californica]AIA29249.1 hypothetical protein MCFN_00350 [Mycoplasmopsis californica]BAP01290.1 hypothetical protein MCAL160_0957 [Mycoplasmopsis californica HAZ160_1]BBG41164.1 hypothetical protein MCAL106_0957 [Mycoplasmopsis californica]BBG41757.1 hypothetical protein MCAL106E_0957 [Mycoplasmopsis californica]BBG42351.1 hypothetical protein MCAL106L_0957 [Mycoplasmopsis californica]
MNLINNQFSGATMSPHQRYNVVKALASLEKDNITKSLDPIELNPNAFEKANKKYSKFMQTLRLLSPASELIIKNEFCTKTYDKEWYDKHFSRTTYYKNRKKAIEEFLYFYLNE